MHRLCAGPFLKATQEFVWAPDLKAELGRLNSEFAKLSVAERELGLMKFAPVPIGSDDDLLLKIWDRHTPGWRGRHASPKPLFNESEKRIAEHLRSFASQPTMSAEELKCSTENAELDEVAISRMVPKRKGSWWLLPKDLKDDEEAAASGD